MTRRKHATATAAFVLLATTSNAFAQDMSDLNKEIKKLQEGSVKRLDDPRWYQTKLLPKKHGPASLNFLGNRNFVGVCSVNGLEVETGKGVFLDNTTLYAVTARSNNCQLTPLATYPAGGDTLEPFVTALTKTHPILSMGLKLAMSDKRSNLPEENLFLDIGRDGKKILPQQMIIVPSGIVDRFYLAQQFYAIQAKMPENTPLRLAGGTSTPSTPQPEELTGAWWKRTDLVPEKLASPLRVVKAGQQAGTFALSNGAEVPANSIIIAEATRAYYLDKKGNLLPFITLPAAGGGQTVARGGRIPQPPIGVPIDLNKAFLDNSIYLQHLRTGLTVVETVETAAAAAALPVIGLGAVAFGVGIAGAYVIAYGINYAEELWNAKQQMGMSDTELGTLASQLTKTKLPTNEEINDAIKRTDPANIDPRAEGLKSPGNCSEELKNKLEAEKNKLCDNISRCKGEQKPENIQQYKEQLMTTAKRFEMCARKREEINNTCYYGGISATKNLPNKTGKVHKIA